MIALNDAVLEVDEFWNQLGDVFADIDPAVVDLDGAVQFFGAVFRIPEKEDAPDTDVDAFKLDPEERIVYIVIKFFVKGVHVLGSDGFLRLLPDRIWRVDHDPVEIRCGEIDGGLGEVEVFFDDVVHEQRLFQIGVLLIQIEDDVRADTGFAAGVHGVGHIGQAVPAYGRFVFLIRLGLDGDMLGQHEGGIEADAEMADDGILAGLVVLIDEVRRAGEGDLVDIFVDIVRTHADAVVADDHALCFKVERDGYPAFKIL